ncbi:MAG: hypothetical protein PVG30_09355 [Gammaproteobacteria bacterium]|jgi:hypothetical protein
MNNIYRNNALSRCNKYFTWMMYYGCVLERSRLVKQAEIIPIMSKAALPDSGRQLSRIDKKRRGWFLKFKDFFNI